VGLVPGGRELLVLVFGGIVLHGETPRGVIVSRLGTTLRARLHYDFSGPLERARFFETPMPSLFHVGLSDRDVL
jgi:hypothetical protein